MPQQHLTEFVSFICFRRKGP